MTSFRHYGWEAPSLATLKFQRPAAVNVRNIKRILNRERDGAGLEFNFIATATVSRSTEER
jgi:hypothetical protein